MPGRRRRWRWPSTTTPSPERAARARWRTRGGGCRQPSRWSPQRPAAVPQRCPSGFEEGQRQGAMGGGEGWAGTPRQIRPHPPPGGKMPGQLAKALRCQRCQKPRKGALFGWFCADSQGGMTGVCRALWFKCSLPGLTFRLLSRLFIEPNLTTDEPSLFQSCCTFSAWFPFICSSSTGNCHFEFI